MYDVLLDKFLADNITPSELKQLRSMVCNDEQPEQLEAAIHQVLQQQRYNEPLPGNRHEIFHYIIEEANRRTAPVIPMHKPASSLKRSFKYIAAILILAIGAGLYYFNTQSYKSNKSQPITVQTRDVAPGGNKAIWTLADGKKIELDSTVLDMTTSTTASNITGYNELQTPRGGQYQLILPDGSKVWLNAASSIKYPVAFSGKERRVEITGEAYFEITKDKAKPFKVSGGGQEIEVLGTSFNINIYDDEPVRTTTLLAGRIRVTPVGAPLVGARNHADNTIRATTRVAPTELQPNEQIQIDRTNSIRKITLTDASDIIAWKSGIFNFENLSFSEAMRQLERWYNIEIQYAGAIPNIKLGGKMSRRENLSSLLKGLEESNIHFRLEEGRKLIVYPD